MEGRAVRAEALRKESLQTTGVSQILTKGVEENPDGLKDERFGVNDLRKVDRFVLVVHFDLHVPGCQALESGYALLFCWINLRQAFLDGKMQTSSHPNK